jgi:hypothetical protein
VQKVIALILLVAFLGQTFNQGWYYLGYVIQKNQYIERCENKASPQLHCDGKCQLMKQIKAQQKKEQGQPPELKVASKFELASPNAPFSITLIEVQSEVTTIVSGTIGHPINRPSSLFHPPDCA